MYDRLVNIYDWKKNIIDDKWPFRSFDGVIAIIMHHHRVNLKDCKHILYKYIESYMSENRRGRQLASLMRAGGQALNHEQTSFDVPINLPNQLLYLRM